MIKLSQLLSRQISRPPQNSCEHYLEFQLKLLLFTVILPIKNRAQNSFLWPHPCLSPGALQQYELLAETTANGIGLSKCMPDVWLANRCSRCQFIRKPCNQYGGITSPRQTIRLADDGPNPRILEEFCEGHYKISFQVNMNVLILKYLQIYDAFNWYPTNCSIFFLMLLPGNTAMEWWHSTVYIVYYSMFTWRIDSD